MSCIGYKFKKLHFKSYRIESFNEAWKYALWNMCSNVHLDWVIIPYHQETRFSLWILHHEIQTESTALFFSSIFWIVAFSLKIALKLTLVCGKRSNISYSPLLKGVEKKESSAWALKWWLAGFSSMIWIGIFLR